MTDAYERAFQKHVEGRWTRARAGKEIRARFDLEPNEFWWRLVRGYLDPERPDIKAILTRLTPHDLNTELLKATQRGGRHY